MPFSVRELVRLDHAGDQVAVAPDVLAVVHLVGRLPQPLQDHLLGGHRGDAAEVVRSVVPLAGDHAVAVELLGEDSRDPGPAVDLHPRVRVRSVGVPVGGEQRRLDRSEDRLDWNLSFLRQGTQRREIDIHDPPSSSRSSPAANSSPANSSSANSVTRLNSNCTRPEPNA